MLTRRLILILILSDLVFLLLKFSRQILVAGHSIVFRLALSDGSCLWLVFFLCIFNDDVKVRPHEEECGSDRFLYLRFVLLYEVNQTLSGDRVQALPSVYHLSDRDEFIRCEELGRRLVCFQTVWFQVESFVRQVVDEVDAASSCIVHAVLQRLDNLCKCLGRRRDLM